MSTKKTRPLPQEFAQWMRPVSLGDSTERLEQRWSVVDQAADALAGAGVLPIVASAFGFLTPDSKELQEFVQLFRDQDTAFNVRDNAQEIRLLAASTVGVLLRDAKDSAIVAGLATTTTSCGGARSVAVDVDLPHLAPQALRTISVRQRQRPDATVAIVVPKYDKDAINTLATKLPQGLQFAPEVLNGIAASLAAHSTAVLNAITQRLRVVDRAAHLRDEELSHLAWLINGWSTEANSLWAELDEHAAPIVLAVELAQLTGLAPGPPAARAILSRAGLKDSKKSSIARAINACELEWLQRRLVASGPSSITLPIHAAAQRRLETKDVESWQAGWSSVTQIAKGRAMSQLDLAMQLYYELLLDRQTKAAQT